MIPPFRTAHTGILCVFGRSHQPVGALGRPHSLAITRWAAIACQNYEYPEIIATDKPPHIGLRSSSANQPHTEWPYGIRGANGV